jgi:hypothetical protein
VLLAVYLFVPQYTTSTTGAIAQCRALGRVEAAE